MKARTYIKRSQRLEFHRPLPSSIDRAIVSSLHNLSKSGCMLNAKAWIKVNQDLHEIKIHPPDSQSFSLRGQIVRAKMVPSNGSILYELGIRFEKGDPTYPLFLEWFEKLPQEMKNKVTRKA